MFFYYSSRGQPAGCRRRLPGHGGSLYRYRRKRQIPERGQHQDLPYLGRQKYLVERNKEKGKGRSPRKTIRTGPRPERDRYRAVDRRSGEQAAVARIGRQIGRVVQKDIDVVLLRESPDEGNSRPDAL